LILLPQLLLTVMATIVRNAKYAILKRSSIITGSIQTIYMIFIGMKLVNFVGQRQGMEFGSQSMAVNRTLTPYFMKELE
jgi:hypothetical protein